MENLFYNISQVLGTTIIHSLWQGLIVYGLLRILLQFAPNMSAPFKYKTAFGALFITLGWFCYTLITEVDKYNWQAIVPGHHTTPLNYLLPQLVTHTTAPSLTDRYSHILAGYMPYVAMIYLAGLVFNILNMAMAWNSLYRIRQNITSSGFQPVVNDLSSRMDIKQYVQTAFSEYIDVPCITGHLKPLILLPCAISTYLSAEEIKAILLHELAHVKRNDYLLNLIQQAIGVLLFFNPFSRLICRMINCERENCCDDVVVHTTSTPLIYAQALLKLEQNKQPSYSLALAATGKKFHLLTRIERIMKTQKNTVNIRPALIVLVLLTCSLSSIAWFNPKIEHGKIVIKNAPALAAAMVAPVSSTDEPAKTLRRHKKMISFKYAADTIKTALNNDTTIKNKKYKIVVEDEQGNKKEYNSVSELPEKDREDFVGKAAGFQFDGIDTNTAAKLRKYYTSDAWKKQMAEAQKMAAQATKMVNTPEFKKMQKEITAKSLAMVNSPAFKKQQKEIVAKSMEMAKMAYSPELQKLTADIAKNAGDAAYYDSPDFQKQVHNMSKYYDSPEFKKQIDKMDKYYDSPQFKKQIKEMTKAYDNPKFKKQMEDMGKYYESPDFQNQIDELSKKFEALGSNFNSNTDSVARNKDINRAIQREIKMARDKAEREAQRREKSGAEKMKRDSIKAKP